MFKKSSPLWLSVSVLAAACGSATTTSSSGPSSSSGSPLDADAGTAGAGASSSVVCTSGTQWARGNRGSPLMHPGVTCIGCHASSGGEAPTFAVAGTLYPTAHEPDDCNGASVAGAIVVITDANGAMTTIAVNQVGNFYAQTAIAAPFHAKVVYQGRERAMAIAQTIGDCNSCHTETGANGAPGRIMLP